jgi:hypothetical protein
MRKITILGAVVASLAACTTPATQQNVVASQQDYVSTVTACNSGYRMACDMLPQKAAAMGQWQAQASNEQATSAAVGLGALAVGLGALDAATCCHYGYYHHYGWHHW